jgi:hypothetical protein
MSHSRVALGDVSNRNHTYTAPLKAAPLQPSRLQAIPPMQQSVPAPEPMEAFHLTPMTCVPSMLHHIGLSHYSATFMEHGVFNCGQLYAMPYEMIRPFVLSDEHCLAIVNAMHPTPMSAPVVLSPAPTRVTVSPAPSSTQRVLSVRRNDPYTFNCLAESDRTEEAPTSTATEPPTPHFPSNMSMSNASMSNPNLSFSMFMSPMPAEAPCVTEDDTVAASEPVSPLLESLQLVPTSSDGMDEAAAPSDIASPCTCIVHFKYRQAEFSCSFLVRTGQYVMVSGDRGQDLGLVLRVNTDTVKGYVERTGPQGTILRPAYQKEVDYVSGALRMDEAAAADLCRMKVQRLGLTMEVHYAEYQYDKKKLTFYYESRARVDFVTLLKDLYREFGCRIWMEKVPKHASQQQQLGDSVSPAPESS